MKPLQNSVYFVFIHGQGPIVKRFPKHNPRRHINVQARVIVIVNSSSQKAAGEKWCKLKISIQKVIAALRGSDLCSYTAVAKKFKNPSNLPWTAVQNDSGSYPNVHKSP